VDELLETVIERAVARSRPALEAEIARREREFRKHRAGGTPEAPDDGSE